MSLRVRRIGAIALLLTLLAALAWPHARDYLVLHIVGWTAPHVSESRAVHWASGAAAQAPGGKRAPNIVLILADDLGYNDLSLSGGGVAGGAVPTPSINAIAQQGVNLTQGYAGNATCAPSRAAILTGRYATRFGFEFTPVPTQFAKVIGRFPNEPGRPPVIYHAEREAQATALDDMGIPTSEITLAELLKRQGYHTIHLGKWHLGSAPQFRPLAAGFDESLGFYPGASMYLPEDSPEVVNSKQDLDPIDKFLWANLPFAVQLNNEAYFKPTAYLTDYLGDQAVAAIQANAKRPFFLYVAFNAPHTPLQALKSDYEALAQIPDHRLRVYAAMIRALDRNIGKITAALKAQGLDDNTLLLFTTDNGGANYIGLPDINRPYRGWKASFFEGGIHVPFFIKWPAQLAAGGRYEQPVAHVDMFATAARAAGAALPADRVVDGVDLIPYLQGRETGRPHQTLYWRSGDYATLLDGDWKLQVSGTPRKDWLFNLKDDPTEQVDLAARNPEKLAELKARLAEYNGQMAKPLWPALLEAPIRIDYPLGVPAPADAAYVYWSN